MNDDTRRINTESSAKNVHVLFAETKYNIDYYQRDYKWTSKEVSELIGDLLVNFLDKNSHKDSNQLSDVANYTQYFLGSYVVSETYHDGVRLNNLIDGQQRLTTIMLIFLYLSVRLKNIGAPHDMSISKVRSDEYGIEKFTVTSPEREEVLTKLYGHVYKNEKADKELTASNFYTQYNVIKDYLDDELTDIGVNFFQHWLSKRVVLVEIKTNSDSNAYTVFESMNDRGKPLSNIDMFKGYILSSVPADKRGESETIWNSIVENVGDGSMDLFIRDVLRARYSLSQPRAAKKDQSKKNDWSDMAISMHRWLRENADTSEVKISNQEGYFRLLQEIEYYAKLQKKIIYYKSHIVKNYEDVAYVLNKDPLFPFVLFFAGIDKDDEDKNQKIKLIAKFLDIKISQQTWLGLDYTTENYADGWVSRMARKIRKISDIDSLAASLYVELDRGGFDAGVPSLYQVKRGIRKKQLFWMMAHMTARIEVEDEKTNPWLDFFRKDKKYEIEHLLAANHEANSEIYSNQIELDLVRDKMGALLVLEKSANASLNDMSYVKKLKEYPKHGRIAELLSPESYDDKGDLTRRPRLNKFFNNNPELKKYLMPHKTMTESNIDIRSEFYRELAKIIWDHKVLHKYTSCSSLEEFIDVYVELSKTEDAENSDEHVTDGVVTHFEYTSRNVAPGITGTATVEVNSNNEFYLVKLENARPKDLYKKSALDGFNNSKTRPRTYQEIIKDAEFIEESKLFNWTGRFAINSRSAALEMLVGYGGQTSQWDTRNSPTEDDPTE